MAVVNIFATTLSGDDRRTFEHSDVTFTFDELGAEGPRRIVEGPMYAFVDWLLPTISGLEMCRRLRADPRTSQAHITLILDQDDPEDRRRALRAGADDYMPGPVDRTAMLDRVLKLHSNTARSAATTVAVGDLVIDLDAMQARWGGRVLRVAPNEFRLLRFLAENPRRVHSRREIMEALGKRGPEVSERTVDVWVKRLRGALYEIGKADTLRTVHATGYALDVG